MIAPLVAPAAPVAAAARPARWAAAPSSARGRRIPEPPAPPRSELQRDRDRIVHSTAFRRLVYKTQVFVNHEGDLFRTRLTHSLEVAQVARSAARALGANEDLVEAVALAHDLGHTPFGHAGQDALHERMRDHGGFEHNLQSLRVVDALEQRYARWDGLNLCFETREGILKHCSRRNAERLERAEPGGVARRFLDGTQPGLEAQLVNLADEVAYTVHDADDGVRSGLIDAGSLAALPLFARLEREALEAHPRLPAKRLLAETLRRMLSRLIDDLVAATGAALADLDPVDADAVRKAREPMARFSPSVRGELDEVKRYLFRALYRHPQVVRTTERARAVVATLFDAYRAAPAEMPPEHAAQPERERAIADYIAGMTDRFAVREHRRLTGSGAFDTD